MIPEFKNTMFLMESKSCWGENWRHLLFKHYLVTLYLKGCA